MNRTIDSRLNGSQRLLAAAVLGTLGFLINLRPLSLTPGIDMLFGGTAAIMAAAAFGPLGGLVAGAISAIPTIWIWNHPWALVIFSIEGLVVGWLVTRWGRRPLTSTALYWLAVGIPLILLTYRGFMGVTGTTLTIIALKQPLNGLVNAVAVEAMLLLPAVRRALRLPGAPRLRATLAVVVLVASIVPAVVFGVWAGRREWSRSLTIGEERVQMTAAAYASKFEQYMQLHQKAVASLAATIQGGAHDDVARLQRLLSVEHREYSGFLNLYVADSRGVTMAFQPSTDAAGRSLVGLDFSDREYFRQVRDTRRSVVSGVFAGRGGADLPLVVIVHPIIVADSFAGYVLGALDLSNLPRVTTTREVERLRVIDREGQIVFDDTAPYVAGDTVRVVRDTVVWSRIRAADEPGVMLYRRGSPTPAAARVAAQMLAGYAPIPSLGWNVWADYPFTRVEAAAAEPYTRLLALLVALVATAGLLSTLLSGWLAAPLLRIRWAAAALASGDRGARVRRLPGGVPLEIAELGRGFDDMADTLAERAEELEELSEITRSLASTLESDEVLRQVTDVTVRLLDADGAGIALLAADGRRLIASENSRGTLAESAGLELPLDGSLVGWVARERRPALVHDVAGDPRLHRDGRDLERIGSIICAPLVGRSGVLGTLTATRAIEHARRFTGEDLQLLERLARTAAIAVENARLIEAAQQASRAKSDFIAAMSHELRTPLNAVLGHLQLLELELHGPLSVEQRTAMSRIGAATRHLRGLIEEVLSFAQLEAGRAEIHVTEIGPDEIAREVAAVIEPLAWEKHLRFHLEPGTPAAPVLTDVDKVRQILINLAGNAVKFTDRGEIRLRVEPLAVPDELGDGNGTGDAVAIRVEDTGPGIAAADLARLFQPFQQLDSGLARRHGGTGLGLYLSGQYARLIGGRIEIQSEPGRGSVFSLVLPRRAPDAGAVTTGAAALRETDRATGTSLDGEAEAGGEAVRERG
jgi:signal transduction histidine kinase